jgi:hypothetical protein
VAEETSYTIAFRVSPARLKELHDIAETLDPTEKGRKKRGVSVHDVARLLVYQSLDDTLRKQLLAGQEFLVSRLEEVSEAVEELSESVGKDFETLDKTITQKTGELGKLYRQK